MSLCPLCDFPKFHPAHPNMLSHIIWGHVQPEECDDCPRRCFLRWYGGNFEYETCPKYRRFAAILSIAEEQ